MTRNSLLFKITLLFAVALIGLAMLFGLLAGFENHKAQMELERRSMHAMRELRHNEIDPSYTPQLELVGFAFISALPTEAMLLWQRTLLNATVLFWEAEGGIILEVQTPAGSRYMEDIHPHDLKTERFLAIFGAAALILVLLYLSIRKQLAPLARLQEQVKKFGEGELDIHCSVKGSDEIALLANEFDRAIGRVRQLAQARTLLLRNVAHELKTPITKGRLATEFLPETREREILIHAFERLKTMINEILAIEKVTAHDLTLARNPYRLQDLIDNAADMLMMDADGIDVEGGEKRVCVDFGAFSLALKNLIDNAINHSPDTQVQVAALEGRLEVRNRGDEVPAELLEKLFEPFVKNASSKGLGLGLYIVQAIIQAHGTALHYLRQGDTNIFWIDLLPLTDQGCAEG